MSRDLSRNKKINLFPCFEAHRFEDLEKCCNYVASTFGIFFPFFGFLLNLRKEMNMM